MRVIVTGGTGLIGRALAASLAADDHEVVVLSRRPGNIQELPDGVEAVYWDGRTAQGWGELVDGAGAVVNLAGESIAGNSLLDVRWTPARKRRIHESRVNAGRAVVEAIEGAERRPAVVIQSSAVGYYGSRGDDQPVTEEAEDGNGFQAAVCVDWEASTRAVEKMGVRRAVIRSGVVLSPKGGALAKQTLPFKFFVGGPIGSGKQWYSWIHLADEVAAIRFLIDNDEARGPFNLVAPNPVTNAEFSRALGRVMGRPSFLTAPAFAFKLAFGEAATVLLEGQRVVPQRLQDLGFSFRFDDVEAALEDVLR